MSARIGLTMRELRTLDPAACETDARLVWRDGDEWNMSIKPHGHDMQMLIFCGTRDMRLFAKQLLHVADLRDREDSPFEVVLP